MWSAGAARFDAGAAVLTVDVGGESLAWSLLDFSGPAGGLERLIKGGAETTATTPEAAQ